jgi:hypothetical protein
LDVKKRFSEEQIIGFLKEADSGVPVKELARKYGFSDASFYLWRSKFGGMDCAGCEAPEVPRGGERAPEEVVGRVDARERGDP